MARLHVMERSEAQAVMDGLHRALEGRLSVSSLAPCPVEFTAAYIAMCATQSCGKCTPCRVGLNALHDLFEEVLENRATPATLGLIERTARSIYLSADCAIGYEAAAMALTAVQGFADDFRSHVENHVCGFKQSELVPCVSGCPAGVDIPGYISLVEAGRYTDAVRLIRKDNPLPLVCGYVCEHPCEMYCRRGMVDDPMNIRGLKRFAVDHMEGDYRPWIAPATGKRVAVVGGGPAGLSAAYYLAIMGHDVTIFEARRHLGGMLRYGIPNYRLPHDLLDGEIQWILDCGIKVELECPIDDLRPLRDGFDAVYLAIGAHGDNRLGLPGEDSPGVISAVEMLRAVGDGEAPDFTGKRVAVIGGGNVAMDVARSAVRCGAEKVTIVYRRRVADMTAQDEEIAGAQAEGCELLELNAPVRIECDASGHVAGVVVQPQIIGGLKRGRPAPRAAEASEVLVPCDVVAVAIGQAIQSDTFAEQGIPCKWGRIQAAEDGSIEGFPGVFAGGDCQSGPATVIRAVNAGKVAAGNIDNHLGFNHTVGFDVELPHVQFRGKTSCARCEMTEREASDRIGDFDLVEHGLTAEEAHQEAGRCLRCDHFGFGAFRGGRIDQW
ncbi:FAD-dependent oxidoreductase [Atopobiaceae bacterium FL090493]|nr:FAD-dependent oxidoreductase [Atopobiaceae bacterium FL090493]